MAAHPHIAILQLGVSIWNQWRASEPLTVPNLRGVDLRGLHLENINFCRADLREANFSQANLFEADFQGANLRNANLTRAGLIGANLHGAKLMGAVLDQAYLSQSDLSNADCTKASLKSADLKAAVLTQTVLEGAQLAEAELTDSFDLTPAQLLGAQGVHLACFDEELSVRLGLAPIAVPAEFDEDADEETTAFSEELADEAQWATAALHNRSADVYQPTPEHTPVRAFAAPRLAVG
jgi:hypothetical protein